MRGRWGFRGSIVFVLVLTSSAPFIFNQNTTSYWPPGCGFLWIFCFCQFVNWIDRMIIAGLKEKIWWFMFTVSRRRQNFWKSHSFIKSFGLWASQKTAFMLICNILYGWAMLEGVGIGKCVFILLCLVNILHSYPICKSEVFS